LIELVRKHRFAEWLLILETFTVKRSFFLFLIKTVDLLFCRFSVL